MECHVCKKTRWLHRRGCPLKRFVSYRKQIALWADYNTGWKWAEFGGKDYRKFPPAFRLGWKRYHD